MKRCLYAVVVGMLLALAASGTATAGIGGSPLGSPQQATQSASFGDQSVGEQSNEAGVSQEQGNGNVNVAPAVSVFGDASTWNAQGNGNEASAEVEQSNEATQSQSSEQEQGLSQSGGGCCGGQSQAGEQSTELGDQSVGEQSNEAGVSQEQGNGNVNVAPAVSVFGDASTWNAQGNGNEASAEVEQSNEATQSQSSEQEQVLVQKGGDCCSKPKPKHGGHEPEHGGCCAGQSQAGEQEVEFGDQSVGEQSNEADVWQKQGNDNANTNGSAPRENGVGTGACSKSTSSCHQAPKGGARQANAQGNGNEARADVDQSNEAKQSQRASQTQWLAQLAGGREGVIAG
jgi:hypothetical protein